MVVILVVDEMETPTVWNFLSPKTATICKFKHSYKPFLNLPDRLSKPLYMG